MADRETQLGIAPGHAETSAAPPAVRAGAEPPRRPFRDNPPLILAGIVVLLGVLGGIVWLADRTSTLLARLPHRSRALSRSPPPTSRCCGAGRSCWRATSSSSMVERRRGAAVRAASAPSWCCAAARHDGGAGGAGADRRQPRRADRASIAGSTRRWRRSSPAPTASPATTTRSGSGSSPIRRRGWRASLSRVDLDVAGCRPIVAERRHARSDAAAHRHGAGLSRRCAADGQPPSVRVAGRRRVAVDAAGLGARLGGSAGRARAAGGIEAAPSIDGAAGGRRRSDARRRSPSATAPGQITGVVVASDYLSGDLAERSRRMTKAYEDYTQLRVLKQPLAGVYLSFFVMVTLLILVGSTWMGLYLAKRITRPVQMLSEAAQGDRRRALRSPHRAREQRRIRLDGRSLQRDGGGAGARAAGGSSAPTHRSRAQARRRSKAAAATSRRSSSASPPAWCRSIAAGASARSTPSALRLLELTDEVDRPARAVDVFARADLAAGQRRARPGGARQDGFVRAGSGAGARRPRAARRRRRDARCRHRRRLRRHGAGARRRDAADPRAEGGGVARSGAAAGARDQESADADSAVGRAAAPQARRSRAAAAASWCRSARRRSSARSNR